MVYVFSAKCLPEYLAGRNSILLLFFPFKVRYEQVNGWNCTAVEFYRGRRQNGVIQVGKDVVQKILILLFVFLKGHYHLGTYSFSKYQLKLFEYWLKVSACFLRAFLLPFF